MTNSKYKVIELTIPSNSKVSNNINTIGINKIFVEVPSFASFCVQSTTDILPRIYDSDRGTTASGYYGGVRSYNNFDANIHYLFKLGSTIGNLFFEIPKTFAGLKSLQFAAAHTMTSTCTLRVHVSN